MKQVFLKLGKLLNVKGFIDDKKDLVKRLVQTMDELSPAELDVVETWVPVKLFRKPGAFFCTSADHSAHHNWCGWFAETQATGMLQLEEDSAEASPKRLGSIELEPMIQTHP